ncbi:MAG: penicillin-binding protein 2 [Paludibacteraceae bacterium]|nr:penicillin-binding protein 2 [Paludibacteraceae bacterium]
MINDPNYNRRYVIAGIAILVVLTYIVRLFILQVIDQSTQGKAETNAQLRQTIYPSRGLIYDRKGELLVANQPIYEVTVIVREMQNSAFDTLSFCEKLQITPEEFEERMQNIQNPRRNRGFSRYSPQVFMDQLHQEDVAALQQELYKYAGVDIRCRTLRDYMYPIASHVLGSVGEVNQRDLERDSYYSVGDYSGRDGIERTYEKDLRGEKGVEILMRDSRGRIQGAYQNGELDKEAVTGSDLHLGLDIQTQLLAEKLMHGKVGSVVAIEPQTGEVLALVSSPNWDPRTLVGQERSKNYQALLNDPHKPLMNRATQAQYAPGSTFKILQALVGLQEGVISPHTKYPCNGKTSYPIKCTHDHGSPVDLEEGIEQSCNPYFWAMYKDLLQQDGYSDDNAEFKEHYQTWREHVMSFGLGNRFDDTDISEQAKGAVPSVGLYDKIYGKKGWKAITIRSLSIGQGEILVTPLQLANQTAAIANKGYYITPHLNRNDSMKLRIHHTTIDAKHFDVVHRGMARVMTEGTGKWYNVPELQICGKTGTVQNPHGEDHALFIGFAPMDNPQIAIAVAVENAGFGSTWACPIATLLMEQYLTGEIKRKWLYDRMVNANLIDKQNEE